MEDHKKVLSTQMPIEVEVEVVKPHFEVDPEARMVDIINMKVKFMEVDEETLEEDEGSRGSRGGCGGSHRSQQPNSDLIATTAGNLGTWPRTVIKGSMMHEVENYNKGIMHQLAIKVMSNCL